MKKALLTIDYTNDFVAPKGALTCGAPAQAIEKSITAITRQFIEKGDYVVFAIDQHNENDLLHPEAKLFPPHNITGTAGRNLYGTLNEVYLQNKEKENLYWMDKTRYSAFAGTDLEIKLRERGINEIHLVGCATDICVFQTAVDAYNKGFHIVIHKEAVASFNPLGHQWALDQFKNTFGAKIL
jgi:nicotinamidase-related amidase